MREIKYRVWDSEYKAYVQEYSDYVINPNGELLFYDIDGVFKWANMKVCTIEQCTGIKDKNGKEIYEGDVVAFEDSDGGYEYPDVVVNTGIVEYGELRFYFTNRVVAEMDDFYIKGDRCDDVEVIGNIHENPELLEV